MLTRFVTYDGAELITASEAFRRLGVPQGGSVDAQLSKYGIQVAVRQGRNGRFRLVDPREVEKARERLERKGIAAAIMRQEPVPTAPKDAVPVDALREQLDRIEGKLDQLLALWK